MKRSLNSELSVGSMKRPHSSMFSIATLMEDGDPEHELGSSAPDIMASHSNKDASSHPRQVSLETEEYASLSDDFFIEDAEEEADLPSPFKTIVATSKEETVTLVVSPFVDTGDGKTGIVFEASPQHFDRHNHFHKERPLRVTSIHDALVKAGIHERCTLFEQNTELSSTSPEMNFLNDEDFLRVHLSGYMQRLDKLSGCTCHDTLDAQAQQFQSIFLTPDSVRQAKTAAASLCRLVSKVVQGDLDNGFAVIRPPGHHAEPGMAGGYCIVNNVAVAAAYARNRLGVQKVLIVDWDVHHGNGTQSTFLKDPHVLYFSVHRWQGGNFYPFLKYGGPTTVGAGEGAGFNVNVGWSRKGMGDDEYYAVWNRILMPLARDYKPDLVLVSAGFDAADGDMGECHVTPECFGHLTQSLITLASGKVVCSLEGGYVRSVLRECVTHVVGALLNRQDERKEEPVDLDEIDASAAKNIRATIAAHQSYWNCFQQD